MQTTSFNELSAHHRGADAPQEVPKSSPESSTSINLLDSVSSNPQTALDQMRNSTVSSGATLDSLPDLQIGDGGGHQQSSKTQDGSTLITDGNHVVEIDYASGQKREFKWQGDQLTSITDTDGQVYSRDANGHWLRPDGSDTGNTDATVTSHGTYSFLDKNNKYEVYATSGVSRAPDTGVVAGIIDPLGIFNKTDNSVPNEVIDLPKDVSPFPDSANTDAENKRVQDYLSAHPTNADGVKVLADAHALGISDLDLWHGTGVTAPGKELFMHFQQEFPNAEKRTSTHGPITYQVPIGPYNTNFVFGVNWQGDTFFQLEKDGDVNLSGDNGIPVVGNAIAGGLSNLTGFAGFTDSPLTTHHDQDAALSKELDQSVGPLGLSDHPIHLTDDQVNGFLGHLVRLTAR